MKGPNQLLTSLLHPREIFIELCRHIKGGQRPEAILRKHRSRESASNNTIKNHLRTVSVTLRQRNVFVDGKLCSVSDSALY